MKLPLHAWPTSPARQDAGGATRYVAQSVHQSVEARDAIVRAGGPRGGQEAMDRLGELFAGRARGG